LDCFITILIGGVGLVEANIQCVRIGQGNATATANNILASALKEQGQ